MRVHFTVRNCLKYQRANSRAQAVRGSQEKIPSRLSARFNLSWLIARIMQRVFWPTIANARRECFSISSSYRRHATAHHHAPTISASTIYDARRDVASSDCRCRFQADDFNGRRVSSPSWAKCSNHRRNPAALRYPRTEQSFNYVTRIVPCTTKASTGNQNSRKCFTLLRFFLRRMKEKRTFGLSTHPLPAITKDVAKWAKFMIPEVPRMVWFLDIKRLLRWNLWETDKE